MGFVTRFIINALGFAIGLLGLIFVISTASDKNTNPVADGIVGAVLLLIAGGLLYLGFRKSPDKVKRIEITQKVDFSGDTELERLTCNSCGGVLESTNVHVAKDGSVMVNCPYCNSAYQITEKPTW